MPPSGGKAIERLINSGQCYLSDINRIELLGYPADPTEEAFIHDIVEAAHLLPVSEEVVRKTIELRRNRKIKLPDAIIAATALVHNLTVISRNAKDFVKVSGLQHVDPHKL